MVNLFVKLGLMILKAFGWQRLALMGWKIIHPELVKWAKSTEKTQLDDRLVDAINELLEALLVGDKIMVSQIDSYDVRVSKKRS